MENIVKRWEDLKREYDLNSDAGHKSDHVSYVVRRSIKFALSSKEAVNLEMVWAIAAYHDIGLTVGPRELHEKLSAEYLRNDSFIRSRFSADQIDIMAEAIEDHRASLKTEPRSIYGKIVSQADRDTDPDRFVIRSIGYRNDNFPEETPEQVRKEVINHIVDKYGCNGYAVKPMWFRDEEYDNFLQQLRNYAENTELFDKKFSGIIGV